MILVKLVEAIAKLVNKIMKLSLHVCELILPKEYVLMEYVLVGQDSLELGDTLSKCNIKICFLKLRVVSVDLEKLPTNSS